MASKKILFIVNTAFPRRPYQDASVRYRCYNPAAELARRGHKTLVTTQAAFERQPADNFDIYIFHRPVSSSLLPGLLWKLKKNSLLIADYDDFSFHASATSHLPGALRDRFSSGALLQVVDGLGAIGLLFDCFTLSSSPLVEKVKELFHAKKAELIHNGIPKNVRALCAIGRAKNPWAGRKFFFGYFSGSKSHSRDWALIMEMVISELAAHKAKMFLAGPEDILDSVAKNHEEYISTQGLASFLKLPEYMAQCRFILAPLENTPFTRCKSGIKFFEAALCGCPVLATPIPDIDRFDSDLLIKCDTISQWRENLKRLREMDFDFANAIAMLEEQTALERQMDKFEKAFIL